VRSSISSMTLPWQYFLEQRGRWEF
jgi:hypothetical protein